MPLQIPSSLDLSIRSVDPLKAMLAGDRFRTELDQNEQQRRIIALQNQLSQQGGGIDNPAAQQLAAFSNDPVAAFGRLSTERKKIFADSAQAGLSLLARGDIDGIIQLATKRRNIILRADPNADTGDTDAVIQAAQQVQQGGDPAPLQLMLQQGADINKNFQNMQKTAGTREFESLTSGLTKEEKKKATLIKLGLTPKAVGNALQTITDRGIAEEIGKASATIKQREEFGKQTGASRSKTIDSAFNKIQKIDTGLVNIDRAVKLLNDGAGVGAINRFLPSFKQASIALDNVQKSMALDVIGAVTFGALSQGELDLAKEVALPTGLNKEQLIQHLKDRKAAQEKLRAYFNEQIQFLDQGGTVAGFMREQDRNFQLGQDPQQSNQNRNISVDF